MVIGTRGSPLALAQAQQVLLRLQSLGIEATLKTVRTSGDRGLRRGIGVFVKELEDALMRGEIDMAVHSLKDMPTRQPPGLCIAAVLERADPRDALVSRSGPLDALPPQARVGCESLRRIAQMRSLRPDLNYLPIKGNVDTRLRKVDDGLYDAVVLAVAGLARLGTEGRITHIFSIEQMLPAPGQGAIALEVRVDDSYAMHAAQSLNHWSTWWSVLAERAFLRSLGGGCRVPIAAYARMEGQRLLLDGLVISPDGRHRLQAQGEGPPQEAEGLGTSLAHRLVSQGADRLLEGRV
ncbi:MAG: hydroxymethylbilane synthase [Dehalococcoidia bacterium]